MSQKRLPVIPDPAPNNIYALRDVVDRASNLSLIETAFSETYAQDDPSMSLSQSFKSMEKLLSQEAFLCWDIATLEKYIGVSRIPRGLRIKKFPMFARGDNDFVTKWNNVLSKCSFELMTLIINHKKDALIDLREEIKLKQSDLSLCEKTISFTQLDKDLKHYLDTLEKSISEKKKRKFLRDKQDYDNDSVYVWRRPRSILRNRNNSKNVSFSSGSDEDTSYGVADTEPFSLQENRRSPSTDFTRDMSTPDFRIPKNYGSQDQGLTTVDMGKKKSKWKQPKYDPRRQEEGARSTVEMRYQLRDTRPPKGKKY